MSTDPLIEALALPLDARLDKRVPKKLLLEQGAPTAADKRRIQDGIEELLWVAALKPNTVGVPAYRDEAREYLEIAVLSVELRSGAQSSRLIDLIHRAVPYPVVLWSEQNGSASLSMAHKRLSRGEAGEVVVEEVCRSEWLQPDAPSDYQVAFLASLALARQPRRDLCAVYQGWFDRLTALAVAAITGRFTLPGNAGEAEVWNAALADHARIEREIAALRAQAERETQIGRRVELNLEINRLSKQQSVVEGLLEARGAGL